MKTNELYTLRRARRVKRRVAGPRVSGFTLIELLVVISVIGLLIGLLMPALGAARQTAKTLKCLSNMRNMEYAHWMYMTDYGEFVNVGFGAGHNAADSWVNTLQRYYGSQLLRRSPVDDSPHWDTPDSDGQLRQTSYGVNNYLVSNPGPNIDPVTRIENVPSPAATVHFVYMAESGEFAVSDHPEVHQWAIPNSPLPVPKLASMHLEINAHGGPVESWDSVTNYGFLDGHAETLSFRAVYAEDGSSNQFDPAVAR